MRTRAERRRQNQLRKARAQYIVRHCWRAGDEQLEHRMMKVADNMKICGGECCANPRHGSYGNTSDRLTRQEQRAAMD